MLKKIINIENVGRFYKSATGGDTQFAKYTVIHGANGYGKTTICTMLRSLKTGDGTHILGRATLGASTAPNAQLLMLSGTVKFDGTSWSAPHPDLEIFDHIFVAENIHAGEIVDTAQRRGLYRVIVGEAGVGLAEQEAQLVTDIRTKTGEITTALKAVQSHVPTGMNVETFVKLESINDIDAQITAQELRLKTVSEAATIKSRSLLASASLPTMPDGFADLLAKTIDDIAKDAEQTVAAHLARHNVAGGWVNQTLDQTQDSCPFCGQDLDGVELIAAYRAVFGQGYKSLKADIEAMRKTVAQMFGTAAIAAYSTSAEQHVGIVQFWSQYAELDTGALTYPHSAGAAVKALGDAALALIDRKAATPLEPIALDQPYLNAIAGYGLAQNEIDRFNTAIIAANEIITAKKTEAGDGNTGPAQGQLLKLRAHKTRHDPKVAALCSDHARLKKEKADLEAQKDKIRADLDKHTASMVKPYQDRINELLDDFNAGFRITETKHSYAGGIASSSYQLIINKKAVDIGAGSTSHGVPSFRNTLSAGDKSTLALAFFIAHLERSSNLANKIVVFDDPFNSQDSFRRQQTVHEIMKLGRKCTQVVIMSHDATFLKQLWDKCSPAERAAIGIADHGEQQGSKIVPLDLERATRGRTATDIDHLMAYYNSGVGESLDIIRKMRAVLETFVRTSYPANFAEGQWLGEMVKQIRETGDTHPAYHLYDKLNEINDSAPYHHGENTTDATPDQIDPVELKGLVKRTLRITNNLQA